MPGKYCFTISKSGTPYYFKLEDGKKVRVGAATVPAKLKSEACGVAPKKAKAAPKKAKATPKKAKATPTWQQFRVLHDKKWPGGSITAHSGAWKHYKLTGEWISGGAPEPNPRRNTGPKTKARRTPINPYGAELEHYQHEGFKAGFSAGKAGKGMPKKMPGRAVAGTARPGTARWLEVVKVGYAAALVHMQ